MKYLKIKEFFWAIACLFAYAMLSIIYVIANILRIIWELKTYSWKDVMDKDSAWGDAMNTPSSTFMWMWGLVGEDKNIEEEVSDIRSDLFNKLNYFNLYADQPVCLATLLRIVSAKDGGLSSITELNDFTLRNRKLIAEVIKFKREPWSVVDICQLIINWNTVSVHVGEPLISTNDVRRIIYGRGACASSAKHFYDTYKEEIQSCKGVI